MDRMHDDVVVRCLGMLGALFLLAGCPQSSPPAPPPPAPEVQAKHASWGFGARGPKGKVPGIDHGTVLYWTWNDTVLFAVWTDQKAQARGRAESVDGVVRFTGSLTSQSGVPLLEVAGETRDGKSGRATLNGQRCDLSNGQLLLFATGKTLRLRQLKRDPIPVQGDNPFAGLRADAQIKRFFVNP